MQYKLNYTLITFRVYKQKWIKSYLSPEYFRGFGNGFSDISSCLSVRFIGSYVLSQTPLSRTSANCLAKV